MGICKKRGALFTKGAFRKQTCHALRNKHFANKGAPRYERRLSQTKAPLFTKQTFRKPKRPALRNKHLAYKAPHFTKQASRIQSAPLYETSISQTKRPLFTKKHISQPKAPLFTKKRISQTKAPPVYEKRISQTKAPRFTKQTSRKPKSLLSQRILRNSSKSQIALSVNRAVNLYNAVKSHKNATALCLCNSNFKAVTRNNRFNKLKSVHL